MKDTLLEKLMRLFDECFQKRQATAAQATEALSENIDSESWGHLTSLEQNTCFIKTASPQSRRILNMVEQLKLTRQSASFLMHIIQLDLIGERTLELIIDQLTFSPSEVVSMQELKAIIRYTLADSLTPHQLAFLDLVLYGQDECVTCH